MEVLKNFLTAILILVLISFVVAFFTSLLWNSTMTTIFGLPEIGYWMAFKIQILSALILNNNSARAQK